MDPDFKRAWAGYCKKQTKGTLDPKRLTTEQVRKGIKACDHHTPANPDGGSQKGESTHQGGPTKGGHDISTRDAPGYVRNWEWETADQQRERLARQKAAGASRVPSTDEDTVTL